MKFGVLALGTIGLLALSSVALAQTPPPPPRTGFQMDIRTGYSVPMGNLQKDVKMSDWVSGQVPFLLDIGGKIIPELFLGGYFGFGVGGAGGPLKETCPNCTSVRLHFGAEVQYHILPAGFVNPWIGYGIGLESMAVGDSSSVGFGGFEFARFMGGADFRINKVFGVGPFVDLSMATYSSFSDGDGNNLDITETATHEWLTLGVRFVFFP
jgi:hypothetical protein